MNEINTTLTTLQASIHKCISDIAADEWDLCVGNHDPLLRHSHLLALERSGIAVPENGFTPCHVVLRDERGQIFAAAPAYLKTHSKGELGVDLGMPMAYARSVGPYYPKLQVEVPMMPFRGQRLLVNPQVSEIDAIPPLLFALKDAAAANGASCVQISYMTKREADLAHQCGYVSTETNTFVWRPAEDTSFDEFLARMGSRSRSEIRRHRRRVAEAGLRFVYLRKEALTLETASHFFELYKENFDRHGSQMWLNREYFFQVFETMSECVELCVSYEGDRLVAAVFTMVSEEKAYTQYWGQIANIRFLHFEQVIYRGMERAFVTGLNALDFGPTGAHKAERGLQPEAVYHAAWFKDPKFTDIVNAGFDQKTKSANLERLAEIERLPFSIR